MLPPTDSQIEDTAEIERERIVANAEFHAWNGTALEPWSEARESLLARLVELDVPGGDLNDLPRIKARFEELIAANKIEASVRLEDVVNLSLYLPTAAKLLYLASYKPEEFYHLRGRPALFIDTIDLWAATNIVPEQQAEACFLAQRIRSEHKALVPVRRVKRLGAGPDAGN